GHALLELGGVEVARLLAQGLGDVVVDDVKPAGPIDPDHRRQVGHPDVVQMREDLRDDDADLVVHQREAAPAGWGAVGLERALRRLMRRHCANSFGASRLSSDRIAANRFLAASRPSSNRGGFASGCDQSGCSLRAAAMARGTQSPSHSSRYRLLWPANSRSAVSSSNMATV